MTQRLIYWCNQHAKLHLMGTPIQIPYQLREGETDGDFQGTFFRLVSTSLPEVVTTNNGSSQQESHCTTPRSLSGISMDCACPLPTANVHHPKPNWFSAHTAHSPKPNSLSAHTAHIPKPNWFFVGFCNFLNLNAPTFPLYSLLSLLHLLLLHHPFPRHETSCR